MLKTVSSRPHETRREEAARIGVSVRHLYRLLAAERDNVTSHEPEHVPIVDSGSLPGYHYRLDFDEYSHLPSKNFLIGKGGACRGVKMVRSDDDKSGADKRKRKPPPKFKPKTRRKKIHA